MQLLQSLNKHPFLKGKWVLKEGFTVKRVPTDHAGGKWILSYTSYSGQPGNLEVDFNFMFRDLYDSACIFETLTLDNDLLRLAFVVYGGMNRVDWREVTIDRVTVDPDDLGRKLFPVLHNQRIQQDFSPEAYGATLVEECREGFECQEAQRVGIRVGFLNMLQYIYHTGSSILSSISQSCIISQYDIKYSVQTDAGPCSSGSG
jgi:hypothetical protein